MFNYYNNIFDQINQMCKIYQQFTNEYCQPKCGFPYKNKISKNLFCSKYSYYYCPMYFRDCVKAFLLQEI